MILFVTFEKVPIYWIDHWSVLRIAHVYISCTCTRASYKTFHFCIYIIKIFNTWRMLFDMATCVSAQKFYLCTGNEFTFLQRVEMKHMFVIK